MGRPRRPWRRRAPLILTAAAALTAALAGGVLRRADQPEGDRAAIQADPQPAVAAAAPTDHFAEAFALGIAGLRQGDAHAAARAFETARRINPHAPEVYVNLGFAYLELGRAEEAAALLTHATELSPDMPNAYFGLAEALEAAGDVEGARGAMRVFLHRAPKDDPFRRRAMAALWEWERDPDAPQPAALTAPDADVAPAVPALADAPADFSAFRGRVVVVNVWATWCGPCRAELPSLDRLAAALDPDKFAVVGLSIDRERAFTGEFLRETGVAFPNYWAGERGLDGGPFEARAIPLTVVLDAEGRPIARHEGARDWSAPGIVAALSALTKGAAPEAVAALEEAMR